MDCKTEIKHSLDDLKFDLNSRQSQWPRLKKGVLRQRVGQQPSTSKQDIFPAWYRRWSNISENRVRETLSEDVLKKMRVSEDRMTSEYPIASPDTLESHDAYLFGIPTRYGNMPAQFKVILNYILFSPEGHWSQFFVLGTLGPNWKTVESGFIFGKICWCLCLHRQSRRWTGRDRIHTDHNISSSRDSICSTGI